MRFPGFNFGSGERRIIAAKGQHSKLVACPPGKSLAAAGTGAARLFPVRAGSQFHGKTRKGNGKEHRRCPEVAGNEALLRRKREQAHHQGNRKPRHRRPASEIEREPDRGVCPGNHLDNSAQECHRLTSRHSG
jgi:hypothetical protein